MSTTTWKSLIKIDGIPYHFSKKLPHLFQSHFEVSLGDEIDVFILEPGNVQPVLVAGLAPVEIDVQDGRGGQPVVALHAQRAELGAGIQPDQGHRIKVDRQPLALGAPLQRVLFGVLGHHVTDQVQVIDLQSQASSIRHNNTSEVILKFQPCASFCFVLFCKPKSANLMTFFRPKKAKEGKRLINTK